MYIPAYDGKNFRKAVGIEVGNLPYEQLYNLKEDRGQQNNLATAKPEKLFEIKQLFISLRGEDYQKGVKEVVFQ